MSKKPRSVGVFDYRKRFMYLCSSIKEATERTGLKYTTLQKASHRKSHRCKNLFIVPIAEIEGEPNVNS